MTAVGSAVAAVVGEIRQSNYPFPSSAYQSKFPVKSGNAAFVSLFNLTAPGPVITSAANAASFLSTGFSPGRIFTIVGSALAPTVPFGVQLTSAGGVSTLVSGTQGLVAPTDIYYAGAAPQTVAGVLQVTVKIPANAASGNIPVVKAAKRA